MEQLSNNAVSDYMVSFGTHAGMVGKNNEDYVAFAAFDAGSGDEDQNLIFHLGVVADGVGGQTAGELASKLASQTIIDYFGALESITIEEVADHFQHAIKAANRAVLDETDLNPEHKGMATTIACVGLMDGLLFTAHVGDSRIYLYRNTHLHQLSNDHSWVQEALQAGIITEDEAKGHPNRNIIRRSLGTMQSVEADHTMLSSDGDHFWQGMPLRKGDHVLLCSDGLNDMISDYDIKLSIEQEHEDVADLVVELIDKANEAGGRDNITVMMFRPAPSFKPNRMMPIPPPTGDIIRRSDRRPQSEQITLVGQSIKSNSIAPVTIRSMPKVTREMVDARNKNGNHQFSKASTVKMKTQKPTKLGSTVTKKAIDIDSLSVNQENGHHSPKVIPTTPRKRLAPIYRWMMRLVLTLAFIAILLAVVSFFFR